MSGTRGPLLVGLAAALLAGVLAACSVDRAENEAYKPCTVHSECESNQCHKGHCVALGTNMPREDAAMPREDAAPGADAAMDAGGGSDGGDGGNEDAAIRCAADSGTMYCYSGPQGTDVVGQCRPGTRTCEEGVYGPCIGQVVPRDETCNDDDDDCDGETDEELEDASCETGLQGVCAMGIVTCDRGRPMCEQAKFPEAEVCDGLDNDCNGETDEGEIASAPCFPADTAGCTLENGAYTCLGVCRAGIARCEGGVMLDCDGAVPPSEEVCTESAGPIAADEDCDGVTDEDCDCDNGDMQPCYDGPEGTIDVGECHAGEQECIDNAWRPCLGAQLPEAETCANVGEDNDCGNGDFVPGGKVCVDPERQGRCAFGIEQCVEADLLCVLNEARVEQCDMRDDDCDGHVDEDFDLQADEQNCGQCGNSCDEGDECCDGRCIEVGADERNCGGCGMECGSGLTCCNGDCFDLRTSTAHCGVCGNTCQSGFMCCPGGQCKSVLCLL